MRVQKDKIVPFVAPQASFFLRTRVGTKGKTCDVVAPWAKNISFRRAREGTTVQDRDFVAPQAKKKMCVWNQQAKTGILQRRRRQKCSRARVKAQNGIPDIFVSPQG